LTRRAASDGSPYPQSAAAGTPYLLTIADGEVKSPFGSRAWINNWNIERGIGEIEMNADLKHKRGYDDVDRAKRARMHQEEVLDDALKNTFPASDPVSIVISEERRE
jgi:hypothetical protein